MVWLEGTKARDGESRQPLLVRKSDGGYMYATTDLAALTQRLRPKSAEGEGAARLLYVTDAGQAGHFQQVGQARGRGGATFSVRTSYGLRPPASPNSG